MTATTASDVNRPRSRRALLAGALGGIGAWAAAAIGRASPVAGANGDVIHVGDSLTGTTLTRISNSANTSTVFEAQSTQGYGIHGGSSSSSGVRGTSSTAAGVEGDSNTGIGVSGQSNTYSGVHGWSTSGVGVMAHSVEANGILASGGHLGGRFSGTDSGVWASNHSPDNPAIMGWADLSEGCGVTGTVGPPPSLGPRGTGVYGYALNTYSRGVVGEAPWGQGVRGESEHGVGVYAINSSGDGFALRTHGRLKAEQVSGVATIAAGSTTVTVNPGVNVTSSSFVLLTPKANVGSRALWFTTNPTADSITLHIGSKRTSATKIAWLLLG